MKLISLKICPFVQRVTAMLAVKNIPYEIEYINLNNKPQWFQDISPNGQVPVLITDSSIPLFESDAIVEYLDEISTPIEKNISAEQRAIDRAWSYMATKNYLVQCSTMRSKTKAILLERSEKLRSIFSKAENYLGVGPLFKGNKISNVDIAWLPLLHRADLIKKHSSYDFLTDYPKVKFWQQALIKMNIINESVADDFEEKFSTFYLSEQTFLGCKKQCNSKVAGSCSFSICC